MQKPLEGTALSVLDFYRSQMSMTSLDWGLRAVAGYLFLVVTAKALGQRSIWQLRYLDFIIALLLGDILANPLSDPNIGLIGPMITTIVLVALYTATSWLGMKWNLLKHFLDPPPLVFIRHGRLQMKNLRKARISVDHLFSELRKLQVDDVAKVALALWEPGGVISVFLETPHQAVTAQDLNIQTTPFSLIKPIIVEGASEEETLAQHGKDLAWLQTEIAARHTTMANVVLATIDDQGRIRIESEKDEQTLH
ncbi:DUF421 domain-containing protein [Paenibacillus ferrarius]|uniref:DUF421 domain-containing protein n=1 Tax=Paenibacillus ferrarius TaxID=1469647 RepID=UPI003D2A89D4